MDDLNELFDRMRAKLNAEPESRPPSTYNVLLLGSDWDEVEARPASAGGTTLFFFKGKRPEANLVFALTIQGSPAQALKVAMALEELHLKDTLGELLGVLNNQVLSDHAAHIAHGPGCPVVGEKAKTGKSTSNVPPPPNGVTRL